MTILAIDTAAGQCAVGLLRPDGHSATRSELRPHGQSERLLPLLTGLLTDEGIGFAKLSAIAVTTGPGSFTGLRVGLAAAQGLALALDIPAIGIDSFQAFDLGVPSMLKERFEHRLVVIESRRAELYWQLSGVGDTPATHGNIPAEIAAASPPGQLLVTGDATDSLRVAFGDRTNLHFYPQKPGPDPLAVARVAEKLLRWGTALPLATPTYVRPPDTSGQKS